MSTVGGGGGLESAMVEATCEESCFDALFSSPAERDDDNGGGCSPGEECCTDMAEELCGVA